VVVVAAALVLGACGQPTGESATTRPGGADVTLTQTCVTDATWSARLDVAPGHAINEYLDP
jgi:hypothetical protein